MCLSAKCPAGIDPAAVGRSWHSHRVEIRVSVTYFTAIKTTGLSKRDAQFWQVSPGSRDGSRLWRSNDQRTFSQGDASTGGQPADASGHQPQQHADTEIASLSLGRPAASPNRINTRGSNDLFGCAHLSYFQLFFWFRSCRNFSCRTWPLLICPPSSPILKTL